MSARSVHVGQATKKVKVVVFDWVYFSDAVACAVLGVKAVISKVQIFMHPRSIFQSGCSPLRDGHGVFQSSGRRYQARFVWL
jgi:hypothetical protein